MTKKDILWKIVYLAVAGGVFMIDQTTKAWAARRLRFEGDFPVIKNFLNFAYAQNTGVAFSMTRLPTPVSLTAAARSASPSAWSTAV